VPHLLLDVREKVQFDICSLPSSLSRFFVTICPSFYVLIVEVLLLFLTDMVLFAKSALFFRRHSIESTSS